MPKTLFEKVWDAHAVRRLANGQTQLLVGTHLIHEVTSPQAFGMLRDLGLKVAMPHRTFATVDHIVPTDQVSEPFADPMADAMIKELRRSCAEFGITFFDRSTGKQGIVHIVGPEQGITQPGTTIACGDSHTSTHGAFGAIAFGIGTTQIRDVLATQTMALGRLKVRRIEVNGRLRPGVYAKDVILHIICTLGVNGGTGYAYEYAGEVFDRFSMEERMTVCNMSIEGGARAGLRQSGRDDLRLPEGQALFAEGRRVGRGRGALEGRARATPAAPTTTSSGSTRPTSRRRSPGASTRARASRSPGTSRTRRGRRARTSGPRSRRRSPT